MFFIFTLIIFFSSVVLISSLFQHTGKIGYILSLFVLGYAEIVLISEVGSLSHQIQRNYYIIAHLVIGCASLVLWVYRGKPKLFGPLIGSHFFSKEKTKLIKTKPGLEILLFCVILILVLGVEIILVTPQNNYDSMTYHLSRVGYWIQHKTLSPWPTPNTRQTAFPLNAELGLLWTVLLSGSDQLTGFVQWISALGIALGIYGLAKLLGSSRSQGVFAALIWFTFPQIILQSTTTQNDLVVTLFTISMLYFLYLGLAIKHNKLLILSGIAFGLAVGTKLTFLFIIPGLVIAISLIWLEKKYNIVKKLLYWSICCLVGFGLFGIFNFVQNQLYYGNPIGIPKLSSSIIAQGKQESRWIKVFSNLSLYSLEFLDFTGLPKGIAEPLDEMKSNLAQYIFYDSSIPFFVTDIYSSAIIKSSPVVINEASSAFGPLSIILLPIALIQLWKGIRKREMIKVGLVTMGFGFIIVLSFIQGWTPYRIRYFVLPVSILAPLMAFVYQPNEKKTYIYGFITVLGAWVMVSSVLQNASKPLVGPDLVWWKSRNAIRLSNNSMMTPVFEMVEEHVPNDAILGTSLGADHWDFIFFGDGFSRKIIQMDPEVNKVDYEFLKESDVEFILIAPRERSFLEIPKGFKWIDDVSGWYLFSYSDSNFSEAPKFISEKLLGQRDEDCLVEVDSTLVGKIGLTELYTADWGVENDGISSLKWLGEGLNQGLSGFLWSNKNIPVIINFHLQAGPSREDLERNLSVYYYKHDSYGSISEGRIGHDIRISGAEIYSLVANLTKGLNEFRIYDLDTATIPELPNGDTRPLLTLITHIDIKPFDVGANLIEVNDQLRDRIEVLEDYSFDWGLEYFEEKPFLWMGEGMEQGFKAYIWAEEEMSIRTVFHLVPGPSREDTTRNVQITNGRYGFYKDSEPLSKNIQFNSPIQYEMIFKLERGLNFINLEALDEATIEQLPNGDTRPLLVLLQGVEINPIYE